MVFTVCSICSLVLFSSDAVGFMNAERFHEICQSLLDLLDLVVLKDLHVSCIGYLAWSVKNDILWKSLHYGILMKSRHESSKVSCASLLTLSKCSSTVGEEFLVMLPESMPFIAKLLEDSDKCVEQCCHQVI